MRVSSMNQQPRDIPTPQRRRIFLPFMLLLLIGAPAITTFGAIGYLLWPGWPQAEVVEEAEPLPMTVSGLALKVPPAAIRVAQQRRAGTQERLDLAYQWPPLSPPDPLERPLLSGNLAPRPQVFISIAEPEEKLPAAERLKAIYPRYLAATAFTGPEGLAGIAFRDGTPYQGEDLLFDADAPERFTVRCTREGTTVPGTCLLERHVGPAEVTVRFPRLWLDVWPELTADIDGLVAQMQADS